MDYDIDTLVPRDLPRNQRGLWSSLSLLREPAIGQPMDDGLLGDVLDRALPGPARPIGEAKDGWGNIAPLGAEGGGVDGVSMDYADELDALFPDQEQERPRQDRYAPLIEWLSESGAAEVTVENTKFVPECDDIAKEQLWRIRDATNLFPSYMNRGYLNAASKAYELIKKGDPEARERGHQVFKEINERIGRSLAVVSSFPIDKKTGLRKQPPREEAVGEFFKNDVEYIPEYLGQRWDRLASGENLSPIERLIEDVSAAASRPQEEATSELSRLQPIVELLRDVTLRSFEPDLNSKETLGRQFKEHRLVAESMFTGIQQLISDSLDNIAITPDRLSALREAWRGVNRSLSKGTVVSTVGGVITAIGDTLNSEGLSQFGTEYAEYGQSLLRETPGLQASRAAQVPFSRNWLAASSGEGAGQIVWQLAAASGAGNLAKILKLGTHSAKLVKFAGWAGPVGLQSFSQTYMAEKKFQLANGASETRANRTALAKGFMSGAIEVATERIGWSTWANKLVGPARAALGKQIRTAVAGTLSSRLAAAGIDFVKTWGEETLEEIISGAAHDLLGLNQQESQILSLIRNIKDPQQRAVAEKGFKEFTARVAASTISAGAGGVIGEARTARQEKASDTESLKKKASTIGPKISEINNYIESFGASAELKRFAKEHLDYRRGERKIKPKKNKLSSARANEVAGKIDKMIDELWAPPEPKGEVALPGDAPIASEMSRVNDAVGEITTDPVAAAWAQEYFDGLFSGEDISPSDLGVNPESWDAVKSKVKEIFDEVTAERKANAPSEKSGFSAAQINRGLEDSGYKLGNVTVVQSESDLPTEAIKAAAKRKVAGSIGAVKVGDQIYVVADNTTTRNAVLDVLHEDVGHLGVEKVFGQDNLGRAMEEVFRGRSAAQMERFGARYNLDLSTPAGRQEAAAEFLASAAETVDDPTLWDSVVAAVRGALRRMGIVTEFTDAEVRSLIGRARAASPYAGVKAAMLADVMSKLEAQSAAIEDAETDVEAGNGWSSWIKQALKAVGAATTPTASRLRATDAASDGYTVDDAAYDEWVNRQGIDLAAEREAGAAARARTAEGLRRTDAVEGYTAEDAVVDEGHARQQVDVEQARADQIIAKAQRTADKESYIAEIDAKIAAATAAGNEELAQKIRATDAAGGYDPTQTMVDDGYAAQQRQVAEAVSEGQDLPEPVMAAQKQAVIADANTSIGQRRQERAAAEEAAAKGVRMDKAIRRMDAVMQSAPDGFESTIADMLGRIEAGIMTGNAGLVEETVSRVIKKAKNAKRRAKGRAPSGDVAAARGESLELPLESAEPTEQDAERTIGASGSAESPGIRFSASRSVIDHIETRMGGASEQLKDFGEAMTEADAMTSRFRRWLKTRPSGFRTANIHSMRDYLAENPDESELYHRLAKQVKSDPFDPDGELHVTPVEKLTKPGNSRVLYDAIAEDPVLRHTFIQDQALKRVVGMKAKKNEPKEDFKDRQGQRMDEIAASYGLRSGMRGEGWLQTVRKTRDAMISNAAIRFIERHNNGVVPAEMLRATTDAKRNEIMADIVGSTEPAFGGFHRSFNQLLIDRMNHATREEIRGQFYQAVRHAWRNNRAGRYNSLFVTNEPMPRSKKGREEWAKTLINKTAEMSDLGQSPLKRAKKTMAALNSNVACPMITIGNSACWLNACYLTGLGASPGGVTYYEAAIYTGEILQLPKSVITFLNRQGGLRLNGLGDFTPTQQGQLRDIIRDAKDRGLKLKIITKQNGTIKALQSYANQGDDISGITAQASMDYLWVPVDADLDTIESGISEHLKGIGSSVAQLRKIIDGDPERGVEPRPDQGYEILRTYYEDVMGREFKLIDGRPYRKYGFSWEQVEALNRENPDVRIQPRWVATSPQEIADAALAAPPGTIFTLMHGVVDGRIRSDKQGGGIVNFGDARHIVDVEGRLLHGTEHGGEEISKDSYKAVNDYIHENFTDAEQAKIYQTLKEGTCCQENDSPDACAQCAADCTKCKALDDVLRGFFASDGAREGNSQQLGVNGGDDRVAPELGGTVRLSAARDSEYLAAVERGDTATAQRMVDEAAKAAGYNVGPVYHGSPRSGFNSFQIPSTGFNSTFLGSYEVNRSAAFFTPNKEAAQGYQTQGGRTSGGVRGFFLDGDFVDWRRGNISDAQLNTLEDLGVNPKWLDQKAGSWELFDKEEDPDGVLVSGLKQMGYDGAIISESMDGVDFDSYAVFDPSQIKSADPITRDDSGRIIPPSERFNPQSDDIRFSASRSDINPRTGLPSDAGRPDLSQISPRQDVRERIVKPADVQRNLAGEPRRRPQSGVRAAASERIARDPNGEWSRFLNGEIDYGKDEDTAVAMQLIDERGAEGLRAQDAALTRNAIRATMKYRAGRSEIARALAIGEDPLGRNRRIINEALLYPGRKLEAKMKGLATDSAEYQKLLDEALEHVAARREAILDLGYDPAELSDDTLNDANAVGEIVRTMQQHDSGWGDVLYEWWINAVLSGPTTQLANVIGNVGGVALEYGPQRILEAMVGKAIGVKDGPTIGELQWAYRGFGPRLAKAMRNGIQTFRTEHRASEGSKLEAFQKAIPGLSGQIIRIPGRSLEAADEIFKSWIFETEMLMLAHRQAAGEGLSGEALGSRMADILERPSVETVDKATEQMLYLTFQSQPGALTEHLNKLKSVPGWRWLFKFNIPFLRTGANIIARGAKLASPIGLGRMAVVAGKGGYRGNRGRLAHDIAEQLIGMALTGTIAMLVNGTDDEDPRLTGSYPPGASASERAWLDEHQPRSSFRAGGRWFNYSRIEPFATPLTLVVDGVNAIKDAAHGKDIDEVAKRFWETTKSVFRDKTFMKGIGDVIKLIEDSERNPVDSIITSFAASWMPNIVRATLRATDPVRRDYKNRAEGVEWWKTLATRIGQQAVPSAGLSPFPKRDYWGDEMKKGEDFGNGYATDVVYRALVPLQSRPVTVPEVVDRMLFNWNSRDDLRGGEDGWWPGAREDERVFARQKIKMTPSEYDRYLQLAGQYTKEMAATLEWDADTPTKRQIDRFKDVYSRGGDRAWKDIVRARREAGLL